MSASYEKGAVLSEKKKKKKQNKICAYLDYQLRCWRQLCRRVIKACEYRKKHNRNFSCYYDGGCSSLYEKERFVP